MLVYRLLTAMALIPLTIIVLFFIPLSCFVVVVILVCSFAVFEWTQFIGIKRRTYKVFYAVLSALVLFVVYFFLSNQQFILLVRYSLLMAVVWWSIALLLVVTYPQCSLIWRSNRLIQTIFGFCTIFPFFMATIRLRSFNYDTDATTGAYLLLYALILVWITDSAAYFVGLLLGRHQLAATISPSKTVEGFVGGIGVAFVFSLFISDFLLPVSFPYPIILVSLITILVSVVGDLSESMFKRSSAIKDSGKLILGHGGILDRIDSLTAAVPIFAVLFTL